MEKIRPPIVLHSIIPNSGSTSFVRALLNRCISEDSLLCANPSALSETDIQKGDFIHGHFPPIVGKIWSRPVFNMILFRDPIAKFVTDYNFMVGYYLGRPCQHGVTNVNPAPEITQQWVPKDFIDSLSSIETYADYLADLPTERNTNIDGTTTCWLKSFFPGELAAVSDGPEWVERAIDVITRTYDFIGITELIEEALFGLCQQLGWPEPGPWVRWGVYQPTTLPDSLSADTIARIRRAVPYDIVIYDKMRDRVERDLEQFSFDQRFLDYKARAILSDPKLMEAHLTFNAKYLPKAILTRPDILRTLNLKIMTEFCQSRMGELNR